jgi:hypothetical protein
MGGLAGKRRIKLLDAEPKVLAHLKRNWIAVPERNEKGLLPRE